MTLFTDISVSKSLYSQLSAWHTYVLNEWVNGWINESINQWMKLTFVKSLEDWTIIVFLFGLVWLCGWGNRIKEGRASPESTTETPGPGPVHLGHRSRALGPGQQPHCALGHSPRFSRKPWRLLRSLRFPRAVSTALPRGFSFWQLSGQ